MVVLTTRYCGDAVRRRSLWGRALRVVLCALAALVALPGPVRAADDLPFFPVTVAWETRLDSAPAARPAFVDGVAVVALRDATLAVVRLETGALAWRVAKSTSVVPAADDRHVYVYADAAVEALDRQSGELAWRVPLHAAPTARMVARAGWLFVPGAGGHLFAFNGVSGQLVWRRTFDGRLTVPPAIDGDRLAVGLDDGRVALLDLPTGTTVWAQRLGGAVTGLQMDAERVYAGSRDRFLYCLRARDGRMAWRWRTGGDVVGSALLDERHVYFASLDNLVRALDRQNGAQRWHKPVKSRALGGPVRAGDTVIVAGLTPEVQGFHWRDGDSRGPFTTAAELAAPPYVHPRPIARGGDLLVVLLADGTLLGARRRIEPPVVPLLTIPGLPVPLTRPPGLTPES